MLLFNDFDTWMVVKKGFFSVNVFFFCVVAHPNENPKFSNYIYIVIIKCSRNFRIFLQNLFVFYQDNFFISKCILVCKVWFAIFPKFFDRFPFEKVLSEVWVPSAIVLLNFTVLYRVMYLQTSLKIQYLPHVLELFSFEHRE